MTALSWDCGTAGEDIRGQVLSKPHEKAGKLSDGGGGGEASPGLLPLIRSGPICLSPMTLAPQPSVWKSASHLPG